MNLDTVVKSSVKRIYLLEKSPVIGKMVTPSTAELCNVAKGTVDYLALGENYDPGIITAGMTAQFGGDLKRVKRTLNFICQVQQADKLAGTVSRLMDADFITEHFDVIRWMPDKNQAQGFAKNKPLLKNIPDDKILLTKYYIKLAKGTAKQTPETPYALYALPNDEQGLTLEQSDAERGLIRHQLTKQDVLTGILDKDSLAEPMVWLSRYDLEDSLMQGTVKVDIESDSNGVTSQFFNVHRNNGIGYQRNLKKEQQGRYWYFKKTESVMGYGKDANHKIPVYPLVTVAGDLAHLGLGKLIMLTHNGESRLTVLADTGGAFENNQYQLDYLGGYFKNWDDYINTYRTFPDYFEARILLLKDK
ncbi:hypothetical protein [Moritella viscosa]|uniref:Uncharacterized protein n=1 Tax=Moritella viscosa TaxID=80854 RepID=A0ABY1HF91_9GAMM|nr:hypothetical protein [Moritella viscosa]SGY89381.1 Putative uncharacterized protein [Moritella viscosa]SGY97487.1 Putative uncharacterized protein [Moritella viscosa]SHO25819.1 Putative uncharacterized protein [Moritella viscosa]